MHPLIRLLLCCSAVFALQTVLFADDPLFRSQVPVEGSWVRYAFSAEELRDEPAFGHFKMEIVVKVLGGEVRDGMQCRWFELVLKPTLKDVKPNQNHFFGKLDFDTIVIKVLATEAGLRESHQRVRALTAFTRTDDEATKQLEFTNRDPVELGFIMQAFNLLDELLLQSAPLPEPLVEPISQIRMFQLADKNDKAENKLRGLPPVALAIRSRKEQLIETPRGKKNGHLVTLNVWSHAADWWRPEIKLVPEVPFGLQSIEFVFRFPEDFWNRDSKVVDFARFELKAIELGDGAKSALPDHP